MLLKDPYPAPATPAKLSCRLLEDPSVARSGSCSNRNQTSCANQRNAQPRWAPSLLRHKVPLAERSGLRPPSTEPEKAPSSLGLSGENQKKENRIFPHLRRRRKFHFRKDNFVWFLMWDSNPRQTADFLRKLTHSSTMVHRLVHKLSAHPVADRHSRSQVQVIAA